MASQTRIRRRRLSVAGVLGAIKLNFVVIRPAL
jgi:hypothetical protein